MSRLLLSCLAFVLALSLAGVAVADEFDEPPINYSTATPKNRVSELIDRLERGEATVAGDSPVATLREILRELKVPESSQTLVFSKTSLQREKISPRTPRAIYFSDDVYVGFCQGSDVLELSAVDSQLGTVFYTARFDSDPSKPAQSKPAQSKPALPAEARVAFQRQTENCLLCHASSANREVPGHLVRSVYTDAMGLPVLSMGSHRIDQSSPLKQRWGGWYVTGTHGSQLHLGNLIVGSQKQPEEIDNSAGQNVASLEKLLKTEPYLTPHSDLVALMVLEHQAQAHNYIARASFQCRMALHQQDRLNKELNRPVDYEWDSTKSRIRSASEDLLRYLLYCDEAPLTGKLAGTSSFAEDFSALGPRDPQGRSLRDFDLERRMFRYPCSYLVYSEAFEALPQPVKDHFWQRLWEIVSEQDKSETFAHLSTADRQAIREILLATKQNLPAYWK